VKHPVVFLDAGGTLFTERLSRDAIYATVLSAHGVRVDAPRIRTLRAEVHDAMPAEVDGHVRYTDAWFAVFTRRLLVALDAPLDAETLRAELAGHFSRPENFSVYADVHDALDGLLERGVRLGVVSNWSDRLPRLLDGLALTPYFEDVVVSAVVGHTKPERGIFDVALARFGVRPDQALHVGDHPLNDLAGARRAGLAALLLDRSGEGPSHPERIRSLAELPGHLC
jgi:putative hydrolase of the HAD superfamily